MHITTIGLDLAKHWFQIYGIRRRREGRRQTTATPHREFLSRFSESKNPAWLAWKLAPRRTIGRASSSRWDMR